MVYVLSLCAIGVLFILFNILAHLFIQGITSLNLIFLPICRSLSVKPAEAWPMRSSGPLFAGAGYLCRGADRTWGRGIS